VNARKFYIRYREDLPESEMQAQALYGFRARGTETVPFYGFGDLESVANDLGPDVGVAGYLGDVWDGFNIVGVERPPSIDYPEQLQGFLGRDIQRMTLSAARNIVDKKLFVKPVKQKLFTGFRCTGKFDDQIRLGPYDANEEVWVSEPVEFVSEYRCFVLRDEIVGARHYKGDWSQRIDRDVVEAAVRDYEGSPVAYTLDFGATTDGKTILVEVNDGYAMGTYGLPPGFYAQMLESRWREIVTGVPWRSR